MSVKRNLLLLMERPLEPVFLAKGKTNVRFDVPNRLLSDRYKGMPEIEGEFVEAERVTVRDNISLPNLNVPMSLGRDEQFTLFIPRHKRIAGALIDIFMSKYFSK